jgi:2-polyprenyl-3-methyl-5-hydroxy-6-metoxy-1,4-benzoquinol methylase
MTAARCCRSCGAELRVTFADLGASPLANSFLAEDSLNKPEIFYPLRAYVCEVCKLVQLEKFESPEHIFNDYLYFSSYSDSWLKHCEAYVTMMVARFGFGAATQFVEIASNDGYLLQYFGRHGVGVLGVEPAANVAKVAIANGIATEVAFFGAACARDLRTRGLAADGMAANNVLAHVPDINDFVAGIAILLKPEGVATLEFPHLLTLISENQFDTIYHEHFSYLSFMVVTELLARHGLRIFDVQLLPTHGGSLRVFACPSTATFETSEHVSNLLARERVAGLERIETYAQFAKQVIKTKIDVLSFLITAKSEGKIVAGYGAPAKGNTLLNYCGIGPELLAYTVDRSPHKIGRYLPGVRIPIFAPSHIAEKKPDYVLILPWNLKDEIMGTMAHIRTWGGRFVTCIPEIRIE